MIGQERFAYFRGNVEIRGRIQLIGGKVPVFWTKQHSTDDMVSILDILAIIDGYVEIDDYIEYFRVDRDKEGAITLTTEKTV